jgi:hypothetical protein
MGCTYKPSLIPIETFGMISILAPVWHHRREASGSVTQLTVFDHITSHAPLQNKVRRSTFIFCMFYVASRAFAQEPLLTYEYETTILINRLLL